MSTRCMIGKLYENGTVRAVYCHHDGYPSYVGDKLFNHYQDDKKIEKLLALGNMSSLGNIPEHREWENSESGQTYCDAYLSEDEKADDFASEQDYLDVFRHSDRAYLYLWKPSKVSQGRGEWYITTDEWKFDNLSKYIR